MGLQCTLTLVVCCILNVLNLIIDNLWNFVYLCVWNTLDWQDILFSSLFFSLLFSIFSAHLCIGNISSMFETNDWILHEWSISFKVELKFGLLWNIGKTWSNNNILSIVDFIINILNPTISQCVESIVLSLKNIVSWPISISSLSDENFSGFDSFSLKSLKTQSLRVGVFRFLCWTTTLLGSETNLLSRDGIN